MPPVENLWKYTGMGFDLVAFSGGKGIRGPQSAGLLLGRKDLIAAARLNGPPNSNSIGRGLKVNKEEMLGMCVAVEQYLARDHARDRRDFEAAGRGRFARPPLPCLASRPRSSSPRSPTTCRTCACRGIGPDLRADAVVRALRAGEPSIGTRAEGETVVVGVWMMQPGDDKIVARRLRQVLERKG